MVPFRKSIRLYFTLQSRGLVSPVLRFEAQGRTQCLTARVFNLQARTVSNEPSHPKPVTGTVERTEQADPG